MRNSIAYTRAYAGLVLVSSLLVGNSECAVDLSDTLRWSVSPDRQSIPPGGAAIFTLTVASKTNINAEVSFTIQGVPSNWSATFDPQVLPDTATTSVLTIQAPAEAEPGFYDFLVSATEAGGATIQNSVEVIIDSSGGAPDFALEVEPLEHDFSSGDFAPTFTYYIRPLNDFDGNVDISVTGFAPPLELSSDVTPPTLSFADGAGKGGTFVVGRTSRNAPFEITLVVSAVSGGLTHSRSIVVRGQAATGGCCTGGNCSVMTRAQCTAVEGIYLGDDAPCSATACANTGACCLGTQCIVTTFLQCIGQDGLFQGLGSTCAECP